VIGKRGQQININASGDGKYRPWSPIFQIQMVDSNPRLGFSFILDGKKSFVQANNLKKLGVKCNEPIFRAHRMSSKEENSNS